MRKLLLLLFLPAILISCKSVPQNGRLYTSSKNRAIKKYESATEAFDNHNNELAIQHLQKAIKIDNQFVEPWLLMGQVYLDEKNDSMALKAYKNAVDIRPDFFLPTYFNIGKLYLRLGDYEKAKKNLIYYQEKGRNKKILMKNRRYLDQVEFALEQIKNPVPYNPVNLGSNINSPYSEWINAITVDESYMIFTVRQPVNKSKPDVEEEYFYYSEKDNETGEWLPRQKMSNQFDILENEGAMFISPDRSFLVYTACDPVKGCDLYISYRREDGWSQPQNMGNRVNSPQWDTHPTIASDNKTIYFASTRKGGLGKSDIYKTTRLEDGNWSYPENLGRTINTPQNERYPFIHPDNNTLYFSSAGHLGMGELDFFVSRLDENGRWTEPQNLGYPINTYREEIGLQVNAAGEIAYISTDRLNGEGRFDIYAIDMPMEARPDPVTYMKGIVYDKVTKVKLRARFELIDLNSGQVITNAYSAKQDGAFLLSIPANKNYALNVKKEGYLFYSDNFKLKDVREKTDPVIKDIPLKPIQVGETVVLNNIFFEYDEYDLLPESRVELNRLAELLNKNPELNIRIQGHTDSRGDEAYNQKLSENRAKAVYDFLIQQGITPNRLSYKGFGESKPIADNDTEEGRAKNRRTEFEVIE
ncbi:MAG: OmpA family protein [Bacteroidales bacterium]|nr:OmpA family protein [Bacteroidales bacterium]